MDSERKKHNAEKSNYQIQLRCKMEEAREELNELFGVNGSLSSPELLKATRKFDKLHVKFLRATDADKDIRNKLAGS